MNVVIGKNLADAKEFAAKWGIDSPFLISPSSINRVYGIQGGNMFVSREAFKHPRIVSVVLTVQRTLRKINAAHQPRQYVGPPVRK